MRIFIDGPEVSLKGSPTVSPTTAAAWTSDPLPPRLPFSTYFLALSQAPPALAMVRASRTHAINPPPRVPPRASAPKVKPTNGGTATAITPGKSIRFNAAAVAMSTHLALSGSAVPSIRPGISRNCLLISSIISMAASPTAVIVILAIKNGTKPPINRPMRTFGSPMCRTKSPPLSKVSTSTNAAMIASAASAAAPMANPLPIAAVVLPSSSRESVMALVSSPKPPISAIPPALSATGP